jgi:hypothetical protein
MNPHIFAASVLALRSLYTPRWNRKLLSSNTYLSAFRMQQLEDAHAEGVPRAFRTQRGSA